MALFTASINSGSNGNCYYVGNEKDAVLVDAGLTCREIEKRIRRLELDIRKVRALFISHEHGDHIKGVEVLSRQYRIPVYATELICRHGRLNIDDDLLHFYTATQPVSIGSLSVHAFPKLHDAADPHSFMISDGHVNIGVFTDIGTPCSHVIGYFSQCHAIFLEANYDEQMLAEGRYPFHLKQRISSDVGHMSNRQAAELARTHRPPFMSHIFLSHLSKDNNTPELALAEFSGIGNVHISVASRYCESDVFRIGASAERKQKNKTVQASLF